MSFNWTIFEKFQQKCFNLVNLDETTLNSHREGDALFGCELDVIWGGLPLVVSSHVAREAYMYIALAFHYRPYTSGSKIYLYALIIRVYTECWLLHLRLNFHMQLQ